LPAFRRHSTASVHAQNIERAGRRQGPLPKSASHDRISRQERPRLSRNRAAYLREFPGKRRLPEGSGCEPERHLGHRWPRQGCREDIACTDVPESNSARDEALSRYPNLRRRKELPPLGAPPMPLCVTALAGSLTPAVQNYSRQNVDADAQTHLAHSGAAASRSGYDRCRRPSSNCR
jgi:hypothetical protein